MNCQDQMFCPTGNCPGCKNGEPWCNDPRCEPYCESCYMLDNYDYISGLVVMFISLGLLFLAGIVFVFYGPKIIEITP